MPPVLIEIAFGNKDIKIPLRDVSHVVHYAQASCQVFVSTAPSGIKAACNAVLTNPPTELISELHEHFLPVNSKRGAIYLNPDHIQRIELTNISGDCAEVYMKGEGKPFLMNAGEIREFIEQFADRFVATETTTTQKFSESSGASSFDLKLTKTMDGGPDGQLDIAYRLTTKASELAGLLISTFYKNEVHINFIRTMPGFTRKGIATQLMYALQDEFPNMHIRQGMLTDDGAKFFESLPLKYIPSDNYADFEKLERLRERFQMLSEKIIEAEDNPGLITSEEWDEHSDLEFEIENLAYELHDKLQYVPIIITPKEIADILMEVQITQSADIGNEHSCLAIGE